MLIRSLKPNKLAHPNCTSQIDSRALALKVNSSEACRTRNFVPIRAQLLTERSTSGIAELIRGYASSKPNTRPPLETTSVQPRGIRTPRSLDHSICGKCLLLCSLRSSTSMEARRCVLTMFLTSKLVRHFSRSFKLILCSGRGKRFGYR